LKIQTSVQMQIWLLEKMRKTVFKKAFGVVLHCILNKRKFFKNSMCTSKYEFFQGDFRSLTKLVENYRPIWKQWTQNLFLLLHLSLYKSLNRSTLMWRVEFSLVQCAEQGINFATFRLNTNFTQIVAGWI